MRRRRHWGGGGKVLLCVQCLFPPGPIPNQKLEAGCDPWADAKVLSAFAVIAYTNQWCVGSRPTMRLDDGKAGDHAT